MFFKKEGVSLKESWKSDIGDAIYSDIVCDDINSDGKNEILFKTSKGILYCLDDKGKELWQFNVDESKRPEQAVIGADLNRIGCSSPIVIDLNKDGNKEIVIGSENDRLIVVDHNGKKLFHFDTRGAVRSTAAVSDINSDGIYEIIFGCDDGHAYAIDASGKLVWKFKTEDKIDSSIIVEDITGDNNLEVIFGSDDNYLYVLGPDGKQIWRYRTRDTVSGAAAVADIDKDGEKEIIFGSADCGVYALKSDGSELWKKQFSGRIVSEVIAFDLVDQGKKEIIVTSCSDKESVLLLDGFGNELDTHKTNFWVTSSPIIYDVDADGKNEVIFGSTDHHLYVLSAELGVDGKIFFDEKMSPYNVGSAVFGTPCLVDLYMDNRHFLIVGTEKGKVLAFEVISG